MGLAATPAAGSAAAAPLTHSLAEQIAARLSDRITAGIYAPGRGSPRTRPRLPAPAHGGPVREALRLLEKDGLVTILPRRGAQVTRLSIAEVREIFDIRAAICSASECVSGAAAADPAAGVAASPMAARVGQ